MKRIVPFAVVCLISSVLFLPRLAADDWPGFRGSRGGVADDKDLPVNWTKENFLWKMKLPGLGTSSPIVLGDKVFVTCYAGYGTKLSKGFGGGFGKGGFGKGGFGKGAMGDQEKLKLLLVCVDRDQGKELWKTEIEPKLPEAPFADFLREHGYASSTPVTDGERIYVFFGKTGVLAFDMAGKQLWQTSVGTSTNKWGTGTSPILCKDLVIVNAAIESRALVALDKKTGKEIWRTRGMGTSWASPIVVQTKDQKQEVVLSLPGKVAGYDPDTGKELWHCEGIGRSGGYGYTCSTPVVKDGIIYVVGGGGPTPAAALAIKAGGRGDVSETHVLWRQSFGTAVSSPVLSGDKLCWVSGRVTCVRTGDGKRLYQERLYDGTNEYTSAVAAGDKIFALTRFDGLFVLAGGGEFKQLAHNAFAGDDSIFNSTPAISNGRLYIRSNEALYCIGNKSEK